MKDAKYPNCVIEVDPEKLIISTYDLTCHQLGKLMRKVFRAGVDGNVIFLQSLPFFIKWIPERRDN